MGQGYDLFSSVINKSGATPQQETQSPNFEELAKSSYGDLEISQYLYQTGLQNVFNDYQQNIEMLSQKEKQGVQDAYAIKEMSKKYLGEYASNTGAGDVSGNLIDIYGNYQRNISEIQQHYGELEFGLQRQYQQQRQQIMSEMMMNQYNIEVAKLGEVAENILFNVTSGQTDGMSPFEYLEKHKEELGNANYRAIYGTLYEQTLTEVMTNIEQGFYGYTTDEEGNQIRSNDPQAYLDQFKSILNPSHFNMLQGALKNPMLSEIVSNINRGEFGEHGSAREYLESFRNQLTPEEFRMLDDGIYQSMKDEIDGRLATGFYGYTTNENGEKVLNTSSAREFLEQYKNELSDRDYEIYLELVERMELEEEYNAPATIVSNFDEFMPDGSANPNYNVGYDPSYFMTGENVSSSSRAHYIEGKEYIQSDSPVDRDDIGKEKYPELEDIFGTDITNAFLESNPNGVLINGTTFEHRGFMFIRNGNNWHRLIENPNQNMENRFTRSVMQSWRQGTNQNMIEYDNNGKKSDTIVFEGQKYTEDKNDPMAFSRVASRGVRTQEQQEIVDLFRSLHSSTASGGIATNTVVFYKGRFWVYNSNHQFRPFKKG
jgi:hypothetical protein